MYGTAYLVRPEAAAYMLISATLIFLSMLQRRANASFRVSLMIGTFSLVAAPYVAWLSIETGQFRIEGKSPLNIELGQRMQQGESNVEALFAVDSLGRERGIGNQPNLAIIQNYSYNFQQLAKYIRNGTPSVVKNASEMLASFSGFGAPSLFAFAMIGLFARPWSAYLAIGQLQIFGILALMIFGTYFISYSDPRFYVLLVPFYCIWASVGFQKVVLWARATGWEMGLTCRYRSRLSALVRILAVVSFLVPSLGFARTQLMHERASRPMKIAGEWLRSNMAAPIRLLDSTGEIAFHAKASLFWLPYCDEKTALDYIKTKKINVVIVRKSAVDSYPYLESWMNNGIPDRGAKLVKIVDAGQQGRTIIFEMKR